MLDRIKQKRFLHRHIWIIQHEYRLLEKAKTDYTMISNFEMETGVPVITNTGLNVMNQPICLSPADVLSTFCGTGMDGIAIGDFLVLK